MYSLGYILIQEWTLRICEWRSAFSRTFFSRGFCPTSLLCLLCSSPSLAPYRGWFPVISSLCCSNFVYFYTFNSLKAVWVKGQHSTTGKDLVVGFVAGNLSFLNIRCFYILLFILYSYTLYEVILTHSNTTKNVISCLTWLCVCV